MQKSRLSWLPSPLPHLPHLSLGIQQLHLTRINTRALSSQIFRAHPPRRVAIAYNSTRFSRPCASAACEHHLDKSSAIAPVLFGISVHSLALCLTFCSLALAPRCSSAPDRRLRGNGSSTERGRAGRLRQRLYGSGGVCTGHRRSAASFGANTERLTMNWPSFVSRLLNPRFGLR